MCTLVRVYKYYAFAYLCSVCSQTYTHGCKDTHVWLFTKFFFLPLTMTLTVVHVMHASPCSCCHVLESVQSTECQHFVRLTTVEYASSRGRMSSTLCSKWFGCVVSRYGHVYKKHFTGLLTLRVWVGGVLWLFFLHMAFTFMLTCNNHCQSIRRKIECEISPSIL